MILIRRESCEEYSPAAFPFYYAGEGRVFHESI